MHDYYVYIPYLHASISTQRLWARFLYIFYNILKIGSMIESKKLHFYGLEAESMVQSD